MKDAPFQRIHERDALKQGLEKNHISDDTNHIINIVKARHKLKDKSIAIDFIVAQHGEKMPEPELKHEFVEEMQQRMKGEHIGPFKNADDLKAYIESLPDEEDKQCTN